MKLRLDTTASANRSEHEKRYCLTSHHHGQYCPPMWVCVTLGLRSSVRGRVRPSRLLQRSLRWELSSCSSGQTSNGDIVTDDELFEYFSEKWNAENFAYVFKHGCTQNQEGILVSHCSVQIVGNVRVSPSSFSLQLTSTDMAIVVFHRTRSRGQCISPQTQAH